VGWCDLEFGSVWGLCHCGEEVVFRGAVSFITGIRYSL